MSAEKVHIISKLQQEILALQGFKTPGDHSPCINLGPMQHAFPNGSFPLGAIHEFLFENLEGAAASCGFIAGLMSPVLSNGGVIFWIGPRRTIFPPAFASFGICPDRIVFIDVRQEKDVLWCLEEVLKCPAVTAVVGEVSGISFTASRRLQLAVEKSEVTGFILCHNDRTPTATASASRWKVTPLPCYIADDLPGIGFPQWKADLLRVRNGRPGAWYVRLDSGRFVTAVTTADLQGDTACSDYVMNVQQTG